MLRREDNVTLSRTRFGRVTVQVGRKRYTLKERFTKDEWIEARAHQHSEPVLVLSIADQNLWQFQSSFYWGDKSLDDSQIYALLVPSGQGGQRSSRPRLESLRRLTNTRTRRSLLSGAGLIITGAVATVLGGLVLGRFSSPGPPDTTQQILFQPWNINGTGGALPGIHIASRGRGYCLAHSAVTGRPDAYKCSLGDMIYDPCIANLYKGSVGEQVICPFPDPSDVSLISLTKALPSSSEASNAPLTPWFLVLNNGDECFAVVASTTSAAGLTERFICNGNGGLYGSIGSTFQAWRIFERRVRDPDIISTEIAKAYF